MFDNDFRLNLHSKQPLADQLRDRIQELIDGGDLVTGQQLPTVRQAALHLDVNFNTVARAYRALDEIGAITTRQGRGTFVVDQHPAGAKEWDKDQVLECMLEKVLAEAARYNVSQDDLLMALKKRLQKESSRMIWKRGNRYRTAHSYKPGYTVQIVRFGQTRKFKANNTFPAAKKRKPKSIRKPQNSA